MPTISQMNTQIPQKVSFNGAETKYNYQQGKIDNMAFFNELDSFEGSSGGAGKKLGIAALLVLAAGVALHKVPADKLPQILKPAKDFVAKLVARLPKLGGKAAQGAQEAFKPAGLLGCSDEALKEGYSKLIKEAGADKGAVDALTKMYQGAKTQLSKMGGLMEGGATGVAKDVKLFKYTPMGEAISKLGL